MTAGCLFIVAASAASSCSCCSGHRNRSHDRNRDHDQRVAEAASAATASTYAVAAAAAVGCCCSSCCWASAAWCHHCWVPLLQLQLCCCCCCNCCRSCSPVWDAAEYTAAPACPTHLCRRDFRRRALQLWQVDLDTHQLDRLSSKLPRHVLRLLELALVAGDVKCFDLRDRSAAPGRLHRVILGRRHCGGPAWSPAWIRTMRAPRAEINPTHVQLRTGYAGSGMGSGGHHGVPALDRLSAGRRLIVLRWLIRMANVGRSTDAV